MYPVNLCSATWRGYQADFSGHRTCRVGFGRGFLPALDRLIGETNCRLASLAGTRLLGQGAKMKVKPLQLDSTVEFGRGEVLTRNFWLLSNGCPFCVCSAVSSALC